MSKGRLEAFSDGVLAILITIMVLDLKAPHGSELSALLPLVPILLNYAMSFVFLGIYWNNHHHLLQAAHRVNGHILWANMHLLFWLSLIPFVTNWMGQTGFTATSVAGYGAVMFLSACAYFILEITLVRHHGKESTIAQALGHETKGKISLLLYAAAIPLAFLDARISLGIYVLVAVMWLIPDQRIEKTLHKQMT